MELALTDLNPRTDLVDLTGFAEKLYLAIVTNAFFVYMVYVMEYFMINQK